MSKQQAGSIKIKPKRLSIRRTRSPNRMGSERMRHDGYEQDRESSLPSDVRSRLWSLFVQIEREFECMHAENLALQERVEALNEKLDLVLSGGEKFGDGELFAEGGSSKTGYSKKQSASQLMSQKIKTTYKASTSKIVSSFKNPNQATSVECHRTRSFAGHRDGVWEVTCARHTPTMIGTASADRSARLWDVETGQCLLKYLGHSGSVNSIRFHPTDSIVCTGSGDGTCHIWRAIVSKPEEVRESFTNNHIRQVLKHWLEGTLKAKPFYLPVALQTLIMMLLMMMMRSHPGSADEADNITDEEFEGVDNPDASATACLRSPTCELKGHEGKVILKFIY
ncbi:unnamed protein product [Porites lobata]|uniref:WD repeat-containing protein 37 n=1 Tax=Porites lobata TaxID=104759 RepID=A0ABN8RV76_9CNID|nr:unnamed protein product [Porites lobata]